MAQKLILKTTFENDTIYRLFRDASFMRHKNNRRVMELLRKKKAQIVTRLEFKNMGNHDANFAVIVEIFESLSE
jgi:hypothetical protein